MEQDYEQAIREGLGVMLTELREENGQVQAYVDYKDIRQALLVARDHARLAFGVLSVMTAVDYTPREPRFELIYELYSLTYKRRLRVKCALADTASEEQLPEIDSVSDIYLTANWHERECYDLMGIRFRGHPDLRRILLPDRWDGYPLRKEYPVDGKRAWKLGCRLDDTQHMAGELGL